MYGGVGGQATVVAQLSDGFRSRGLASMACLYAPPGEFSSPTATEGAFDVVVRVEKRRKVDFRGAAIIGDVVERYRPRIVLWHAHYAALSLRARRRAAGVRAIVMVEHQASNLQSARDRLRALTGAPVSDAVVFVSGHSRSNNVSRLSARLAGAATTVPHGVDLERFRPNPRSRIGDTLRVGVLTRMVPGKDFGAVIRAAQVLHARADVPPFILALAGDGTERARWETLVEDLELRDIVEFVGTVHGPEVVSFLQGLDVLVHPTDGESLSMAIIEGFAVGLPVIASDVSGVRDAVCHGRDGLLVEPRDPYALASAIGRLLTSEDLRTQLGSAARRTATQMHDRDQMVVHYLRLFADLDPEGPWQEAGTG